MELIYIGEHFYLNSGSMMSPIYDVQGKRQDWGKIQIALAAGQSVHIRQATRKELSYYTEKLMEILENSKNDT